MCYVHFIIKKTVLTCNKNKLKAIKDDCIIWKKNFFWLDDLSKHRNSRHIMSATMFDLNTFLRGGLGHKIVEPHFCKQGHWVNFSYSVEVSKAIVLHYT